VAEHENKSTQKSVFDAVVAERRYQDLLPKNRSDGKIRTVEGELLLLEDYIARARKAWVDNAGDTQALDVVRKVVSIGVRCLEVHGVIERVR